MGVLFAMSSHESKQTSKQANQSIGSTYQRRTDPNYAGGEIEQGNQSINKGVRGPVLSFRCRSFALCFVFYLKESCVVFFSYALFFLFDPFAPAVLCFPRLFFCI